MTQRFQVGYILGFTQLTFGWTNQKNALARFMLIISSVKPNIYKTALLKPNSTLSCTIYNYNYFSA